MRVETLNSRIEFKIFAAVLARLFDQPIKQFAAKATGTVAVARDQIVHIEIFAGEERFKKSITGGGADLAFRFEKKPTDILVLAAASRAGRNLPRR